MKRIGVLEANQRLDSRPQRFVKKTVAQYLLRKNLARRISADLIQMLREKVGDAIDQLRQAIGFTDGPLGIGNALPFSRRTDPGHHFHYEVPPAGCIGLWRHYRKFIRVSARKIDVTAVSFRQRYGAPLPHRIAPSPSLNTFAAAPMA